MGVEEHLVLQLLIAIEPAACLRPRDRLSLGLLGTKEGKEVGEGRGLKTLYDAAIKSLVDGDEPLGIRCLEALGELCREVECAEFLGAIGGHKTILRLMSDGEIPGRQRLRKILDDGRQLSGEFAASSEGVTLAASCTYSGSSSCNAGSACGDCEDGEEDEVQAAAAEVAARVASSGCAFPMRAAFPSGDSSDLFGRYPLQYNFFVEKYEIWFSNAELDGRDGRQTAVTSKAEVAGRREVCHGAERNSGGRAISILVRPVKERQHSQFDVGFQMWPAAVILSRWLCAYPGITRERTVLEVGAGLGLCGLVAAHLAHRVTMSDFNPVVLRALEANVALNAGWSNSSSPTGNCEQREGRACTKVTGDLDTGATAGSGLAIDSPRGVCVRHLNWDLLDVPNMRGDSSEGRDRTEADSGVQCFQDLGDEEGRGELEVDGGRDGRGDFKGVGSSERFDLIIASDHICQVSDAEGTIRVLRTLLSRRGGQAHFVVAHPRTRYGVDALVPLLEKCPEFSFTCQEVQDPALVKGLEEADYLAWLHVHVWWKEEDETIEPALVLEDELVFVAG